MGHGTDLSGQKKIFKLVFVLLMIGTALTVYVATLKLGVKLAIFVALLVAGTKGTLVAGYFMHLFHEKKIIFFILLLTLVFFLGLLFLPVASEISSRVH